MRRRSLAFVLLLGAGAVAPAGAGPPPRPAPRPPTGAAAGPRSPMVDALAAELDRSMQRLSLPGYEKPYFISYTVRDYDGVDIGARLGAVFNNDRSRTRQAYVEVRVGDYQFDNTADATVDADWSQDSDSLYDPGTDIPTDDDPAATRAVLWLLTDARYKAALAALHLKRGHRATRAVDDEKLASFSRAPRVLHGDAPAGLKVDASSWARRLRLASALFKGHPEIIDSSLRLQASSEVRTLVNSEGTRIVTERLLWGLHISAVARADDGAILEHGRSLYGRTEGELPGDRELAAAVERVARELVAVRQAPVLDPYTGPAILEEEATGVLFHEVIGHRLEGERLDDEAEGQTFKGQVGQRVLPEFLDVVDDPTMRALQGRSLNGWYRYDDEGVAGRPVTLIAGGILKTYLTSRRPVTGVEASNGHGRAEGSLDPMARMSNLVVRSSRRVPSAELKRRLLEEVRRQGKPFGLILRDIVGGSTNTTSFGYQAFKGTPRLVYKVDAATGEESLVRGVELVGTPLAAINKIVATSDALGVFNGFCGAESGYIPVSAVAPAVLLSEVELQRVQRTKQKPTILPPPWTEP